MKNGKEKVLNHAVLGYEGKNYSYDGIYNLIKDLDYETIEACDFRVLRGTDLEKDKPCILIVFQETTTKDGNTDWKHNFSFWATVRKLTKGRTKAYKGWENRLYYHSGFFREYQYARDAIVKKVADYIQEIAKEQGDDSYEPTIFITGWSLGGSIAPVCAEDINYQFGFKPVLIPYEGANPCASIHTRNYLYECIDMERSIAFVYGSDIVCYVPPVPFAFKLKKIIRHLGRGFGLIDSIRNTRYYHCNADEGINKYMVVDGSDPYMAQNE